MPKEKKVLFLGIWVVKSCCIELLCVCFFMPNCINRAEIHLHLASRRLGTSQCPQICLFQGDYKSFRHCTRTVWQHWINSGVCHIQRKRKMQVTDKTDQDTGKLRHELLSLWVSPNMCRPHLFWRNIFTWKFDLFWLKRFLFCRKIGSGEENHNFRMIIQLQMLHYSCLFLFIIINNNHKIKILIYHTANS